MTSKSEEKDVCEEKVFQRIFKQNSESLRNFLFYKFGDLDRAKDIMQDSFIKLWNNCKKVPESKAKGYIFTVANNAFLNDIAHKKVVLKYQNQVDKSPIHSESPDFLMEEKEFLKRLNAAIASVPEKKREVFLLNRIDKMTYREIAEILGVSVKTVEKRMQDALIILRKKIGRI